MSTAPQVISYSRRTDGVANDEAFRNFVASLKAGLITYHNPMRLGTEVKVRVAPENVIAIALFSKDYTNFISAWNAGGEDRQTLAKYNYHFSFTINGPEHSITEPGLRTTLEQRNTQLAELVAICRRDLHQDPDASIKVHVDPIVRYSFAGTSEKHVNTGHLPALFAKMHELGLTRVHISFLQRNAFPRTDTRLRKLSRVVVLEELSVEEEARILTERVRPHAETNGIRLESCTAASLADSKGACLGQQDLQAIVPMFHTYKKQQKSNPRPNCMCWPFRDVGDKAEACVHGCIYCFSNPKATAMRECEEWVAHDVEDLIPIKKTKTNN